MPTFRRLLPLLAVVCLYLLSCSASGPLEDVEQTSEAVTWCQTANISLGNNGTTSNAGPISFVYPSAMPAVGSPVSHNVQTSHKNGTTVCTYNWTLSGTNWITPTNACTGTCSYTLCPQFPANTQITSATAVTLTETGNAGLPATVRMDLNNGLVDDGNPCTTDSCSGTTPVHTITAGNSCSDGNVCNGVETCSASGACVATSNAPAGTPCTDGNACDVATCTGAGACAKQSSKPDGTLCSGDQCSNRHVCVAGTCASSALPQPAAAECTATTCDPTLGYVSTNTCPATSLTPTSVGQGVATDFGSSIAFLYTGSSPPQQSVTATIDPTHASVIRGRVVNRSGAAVSGIAVSILNHPEFGHTTSRADGWYDMAVNGGGDVVVKIDGTPTYAPVERRVKTTWKRYSIATDTMLTAKNATAAVALGSSGSGSGGGTAWTVVRGNSETDYNGTRRATILFPPGTKATNLTSATYSVSATEVTSVCTTATCPSAVKAMPADLPPNSGYTYAVDLHIDEADTAGVPKVTFNQDVPFYVEQLNLGVSPAFTTGTSVPTGYLDSTTGNWVASTSGTIVKITAISGGVATVDSGGVLTLSTGERTQLGTTYASATLPLTLWRVPVSHFTFYDFNWGYGLPAGAKAPPDNTPVTTDDPTPHGCVNGNENSTKLPGATMKGSFIECHNQALRESIPITDTPYSLEYSSRRAAIAANREVKIPLVGATAPSPAPMRIDVSISVAGEVNNYSMTSSTANETLTWTWDGNDGYGRPLQGAQVATISIAYIYAGTIGATVNFGDYPGASIVGNRAGREIGLSRTYEVTVGGIVADSLGFGGWTISGAHYFDPVSGRVELGSGDVQTSTALAVHRIAGALVSPGAPPVTNGSSALTQDYDVKSVRAGPDGSIFVGANGYSYGGMLYQITPDGKNYLIGGNGTTAFVNGGPSVGANINFDAIAIDRDGSVVVHDINHAQIYRVSKPSNLADPTTRTISLVAGNGTSGIVDGPAATAEFGSSTFGAVAIAKDGSIYVGDTSATNAGYLRRISTAGIVTTISGAGSSAPGITPSPASGTSLSTPTAIAITSGGDIYLGNTGGLLYKMTADGNIALISSNAFTSNEGSPVGSYFFSTIGDLALDTKGRLYVGHHVGGSNNTLHVVDTDGIVHRFAGSGVVLSNWKVPDVDGKPPLATDLYNPEFLTVGPDDSVTFAARGYSGIYKAAGFGTQLNLASADRSEVYTFVNGQHVETKSALTGKGTLTLCYDTYGLLAKLIDETCAGSAPACGTAHSGCETTITRTGATAANPTGTSLVIAAPFGKQTALTFTSGALSTVADPIGNMYHLGYVSAVSGSAIDLLSSYADPSNYALGQTHGFTYTADSLLLTDVDPKGATSHLARTRLPSGWLVDVLTPAGRERRLTVDRSSKMVTGAAPEPTETLTSTLSDGTLYTSTRYGNGSFTTTSPDGASTTVSFAADPRMGWDGRYAVQKTSAMGDSASHYRQKQEWRTAAITDPNNPLTTATSETDTVEINPTSTTSPPTFDSGRTYTRSVTFGATPSETLTTPTGRHVTNTYDSLGRVTNITVPSITAVVIGYDTQGRVHTVTQGSRSRTLTYNATAPIGTLATVTDNVNGNTTYPAYDGDNRPLQVTLPGTRTLTYTYDATGNLQSVLTPNEVGLSSTYAHTFGYDGDNLLASYVSPTPNATTTYGFDADRLLTSVLTPQPDTVGYSYDSGARIATRTGPAPATWTYDAQGRVKTETAAGLTYTYAYDGGLLTSIATSGLFTAHTTAFTYDSFSRVGTRSIDGTSATIAYDADEVLNGFGPVSVTRNATNGLLTGTTVGSITDSYATYNAYGELTLYEVPASGSLYKETITRDATLGGRILTKAETIGGTTVTHTYTYDTSNRLKTDGATTYTYDNDGNRTDLCPSVPSPYGAQDQLLSSCVASVAYSADGRMTNDGVHTFTYDALGNLTASNAATGGITYLIDAENRVVQKKTGSTVNYSFLYAGGPYPVAQLNAAGAILSTFHYATGRNVPDAMVNGGVTYKIITDHLGSVRLVVNASTSAIVQRYDYDAWGNATLVTGSATFQPFGFAGGIYDPDTKLVRFGARDYNPRLGRWMTKDPYRFQGGINLYQYAESDPVNLLDSSGKAPCPAGSHKVDYVFDSASFSPIPWLPLIINPQLTYDSYGRTYFGIGFGFGSPGISASVANVGRLHPFDPCRPSASDLASFIAGDSINYSAGFIAPIEGPIPVGVGYGVSGSTSIPSGATAVEWGPSGGTPGPSFGLTFQHTWQL